MIMNQSCKEQGETFMWSHDFGHNFLAHTSK